MIKITAQTSGFENKGCHRLHNNCQQVVQSSQNEAQCFQPGICQTPRNSEKCSCSQRVLIQTNSAHSQCPELICQGHVCWICETVDLRSSFVAHVCYYLQTTQPGKLGVFSWAASPVFPTLPQTSKASKRKSLQLIKTKADLRSLVEVQISLLSGCNSYILKSNGAFEDFNDTVRLLFL